jgi:hypothetical protein
MSEFLKAYVKGKGVDLADEGMLRIHPEQAHSLETPPGPLRT